jgi:endo-1,4-beta-xylanase
VRVSRHRPASAAPTAGAVDRPVPTGTPGELPSTLRWSSGGVLIGPKSDSTDIVAVKDPSVVFYNGRWHVFASTGSSSDGYNLAYTSFTDWNQAASAPLSCLDRSAIGTGYRAAPQVFYFAPQQRWYLVYQTGNASYSTTTDVSDPTSWTAQYRHRDGGLQQEQPVRGQQHDVMAGWRSVSPSERDPLGPNTFG